MIVSYQTQHEVDVANLTRHAKEGLGLSAPDAKDLVQPMAEVGMYR